MKKIIFLLMCGWGLSCGAVSVQLNRSTIALGENVELTFSDTQPIPAIDFTPLSQDFMLGAQSTGQSSQYINGVGSTSYQKSIVLFPLKEGHLQIPAFTIGQEQTSPLTLNVQKEKTPVQQDHLPLPKLKAFVSESHPYVGQSLFYTLELSENDNLAEAELIPNFPEGIKMTSIGQDTEEFQKDKRILKRPYLIKAEKAGSIQIAPTLLNGSLFYKKDSSFQGQGLFTLLNSPDFMNPFTTGTKPFQLISNPINLNVQEKPNNWQGWWLPTSKAELKIDTEIPENLKAGDLFKITLTLNAIDVDSNDLPIPKLPNDSNFRYYPQPEERHISILKDNHFQGSVQITYEVMPLQEGELTLPEISVPWFNTKLAKEEKASIAPLVLNVKSGRIEEVLKPAVPTTPQKEVIPPPPPHKRSTFIPIILWGVGIIGLAALLFFIFKALKTKKKKGKKEKPIPDFYPF